MLPRLVLIADGFTQPARAERTLEACRAGVPWVHLRDHAVDDETFEMAARRLVARLRDEVPGVRISINGRLPVAEALATGLHVGRRGPAIAAARACLPEAVVGFSAHDVAEGRRAVDAGADYLFFSPVFETTSKPGHAGVGVEALGRFSRAVPAVPVFALGGVTPERVGICRAAGAYGVAVLSGVLDAPDPVAATARYLDALQQAIPS